MAAFLRRCPARCRSRQFSERLSFPPTNHFAKGAFHWRTFFHGARHLSSFASRVQNFTGCLIDSRYMRRSEEHTSELQSLYHLVCRLLLEKKIKAAKTQILKSLGMPVSVEYRSARLP